MVRGLDGRLVTDLVGTLFGTPLVALAMPFSKVYDGWKGTDPYYNTKNFWKERLYLVTSVDAVLETVSQPLYWASRGLGKLRDNSRTEPV